MPVIRTVIQRLSSRLTDSAALFLSIGLCIAVVGLLGLSFRSIHEWRLSSEMLAEQRGEVVLTLLSTSLSRDMKGAQVSVLLPLDAEDIKAEPPDDLRDTFARAFARFPYPESFFTWKNIPDGNAAFYLFNREERPPVWDPSTDNGASYPAVVEQNPERALPLIESLRKHWGAGGRFIVFDCTLHDTPYQVVAKLIPGTGAPLHLVGFTINLTFVRQHYFSELVREVSDISDVTQSLSIGIADDQGRAVASTRPFGALGPVRERDFAPIFFDPLMLSTLSPGTTARPLWKARVGAANDPMLKAARGGIVTTYVVLATVAMASVVVIVLSQRAVRARAELATMQSNFTSTVTHELKTPLASIRLMAEILGQGRYESVEQLQEYSPAALTRGPQTHQAHRQHSHVRAGGGNLAAEHAGAYRTGRVSRRCSGTSAAAAAGRSVRCHR